MLKGSGYIDYLSINPNHFKYLLMTFIFYRIEIFEEKE
jgi:hypothetical protein